VTRLPLAFALIAATAFSAQAAGPRQPLYYQDPSGQSEFSPTPKKDAQGRDFVPVYDDPDTPAPAVKADRGKPLYYRNPMGLPDTSPVPKKDSMGMDYVPVYADDLAGAPGSVTISPERVQMLGVRTAAAGLRTMTRSIRAVATVAIDERRVAVVAPRFEGWIETLNVSATGDAVARGQALFSYYSPDLALAEREYVLAQQGSGELAQSALSRLENLNIPADEIARLRKTGRPGRTASIGAPISGVVMEKTAVQGMRFAAGDTLYRIADLSHVWMLADVFEQDLAQIRPGETAKISVAAYPDAAFAGTVTFVYPTVNPTTRTAKLRIEVDNAALLLKPDMYATVEIAAPVTAAEVLAVPDSAVLDSGTRQVVLVERSAGHFEPHAVTLGRRADGYAEIRSGIAAGDKVVVGANFLIDAESNLRAALQAFTAPAEAKP
jgi:Cu(I)/Ag(I) efflux system membrane fusion protein